MAELEPADLDVLAERGSALKMKLGAMASNRGWREPVADLRAAMREREKERARARLTVHEGGGKSPRDVVLPLLALGREGLPKSTIRNVVLVLEKDSRWVGRLKRNEFTGHVEIGGRPLADEFIRRMVVWLDEHYAMCGSVDTVHHGMCHVADDHKYHPVRDYLDGMEWDGVRRAHMLFSDYCGADHTRLNQALGEKFLISCVARAMTPGCKVDTVPILHGPQGCRKSTFVRVLAGDDWYRDTDIDPHGKSAYEQVSGAWLYEVPEIEKWNQRKDQATIKGFITSQVDHYRAAYGRCLEAQPRSCVFVGTTNATEFLADPTGSRRYWPVTVRGVDIDALAADRDQLWAEAAAMYRQGVEWHLTEEETTLLVAAQDSYQEHDPWEDLVRDWLDRNYDATDGLRITDLLSGMKVETDKQTRMSNKRAGEVLTRLGYRCERHDNKRRWRTNDQWDRIKG